MFFLSSFCRRSSSFVDTTIINLSPMLSCTPGLARSTARQGSLPRSCCQLLASRPTAATLLGQRLPSAVVEWNTPHKGTGVSRVTRGGPFLAMCCLAHGALGAHAVDSWKLSSPTSLQLAAGAFMLPHPDKALKGGEDWYFIANNSRAVGVADGVGGWAEVGVDAGAYARQLMSHAAEVADQTTAASTSSSGQQPKLSAQDILERAYALTTVRGSSTACVAVLNGDSLAVSNIGDSGLLILRGGSVAFHTPQQQHGFNFPFQIGSADSMSDHPSTAQRFEVSVQPGDLIVLGTDGLWDNCFDEEVASVLKYCCEQRMEVGKMAQVLAHYARHRASDSKFASPFAYAAFTAGYAYMGGKMDDITAVICIVQHPAKI
ncbi:hypothetical protein Agub_g4170 [Astrephomene gubernaculifera]|uniref:Protein phosphatase n=1 Tax=Astrephomene gubernaculifera TaxID=47775 RepID=A0AAD3HJJ1_9CHLO|nr:hypothetical protein Agub_g4170 [Astrephomene gubernaculifera]